MGKSLVKKHNNLIKSKFNLSLNEQRILLLSISQIKRNDFNTENQKYKICLNDIDEIFKDMKKSRVETFLRKLRSQTFIVEDIENKNNFNVCSWFNFIKYYGETREIEVKFDEVITPYLFQLKKDSGGKFSSYFLESGVMKFKSSYSIRIYELLMIVKNTVHKSLLFELDKLFLMLELPNSQQTKSIFERDYLSKIIKDINDYSDIFLTYEFIKKGRSFTHIKFRFKINEDYEKVRINNIKNITNRLNEVLKYEKMEYYNNDFYVDNIVEEYIEKVFINQKFIFTINGLDTYILKSFERFDNKYKDREVFNEDGSLFMDDINTTKHLYYILELQPFVEFEKKFNLLEQYEDKEYDEIINIQEEEDLIEYRFECHLNDSRTLYEYLKKYQVKI
jgi:hypothetical protein